MNAADLEVMARQKARRGQYAQAASCFARAVRAYRNAGDTASVARCITMQLGAEAAPKRGFSHD